MVAGASALTQDVPPYCLAQGNRAELRGLNLVGLRRHIKNSEDINELKLAYRKLFLEGRSYKDVAKELLESSENIHVKKLAKFVLETKRGIQFKRSKN